MLRLQGASEAVVQAPRKQPRVFGNAARDAREVNLQPRAILEGQGRTETKLRPGLEVAPGLEKIGVAFGGEPRVLSIGDLMHHVAANVDRARKSASGKLLARAQTHAAHKARGAVDVGADAALYAVVVAVKPGALQLQLRLDEDAGCRILERVAVLGRDRGKVLFLLAGRAEARIGDVEFGAHAPQAHHEINVVRAERHGVEEP